MNQKNSQRRIYRRIHILPSLLTLGNFACGFISICLCLNALFFSIRASTMEEQPAIERVAVQPKSVFDRFTKDDVRQVLIYSVDGNQERAAELFYWACVIIFFGMIFDMLDGKVARHMGADSAFGVQLDSLADVTTFGVAPAVIINTISLAVMPATYAWWTQVIIFGVVYSTCAVLRLARYNIQSGTADKNIFSGLPSPAAAGCLVTAVLLTEGDYELVDSICAWLVVYFEEGAGIIEVKARLLSLFLLLPGLLMVSTVPYTHIANRYLSGTKPFALLVLAVLIGAAVWHEPRLMLFLGFNGYMVWGVAAGIRRKLGNRRAPPGPEADGLAQAPEPSAMTEQQ